MQSTTFLKVVSGKNLAYPASLAFDKAPATASLTKPQLTPWLAIDLGARFEVNKVSLRYCFFFFLFFLSFLSFFQQLRRQQGWWLVLVLAAPWRCLVRARGASAAGTVARVLSGPAGRAGVCSLAQPASTLGLAAPLRDSSAGQSRCCLHGAESVGGHSRLRLADARAPLHPPAPPNR